MEILKRLLNEEEGQTLSEYGLVLAIVVIAVIASLTLLKDKLVAIFTKITEALNI